MKGIFFTQIHPDDRYKGAVQKVFDEIDAFSRMGFEIRHVNFEPVSSGVRRSFVGKGLCASLPFTYVFSQYRYSDSYDGYDFYYFRFEAADYWFTLFLHLLKKNNPNSKIIVEFPDYPNTYWMSSFFYFPLLLKDIIARGRYRHNVDRFAVLNSKFENIYGVRVLHFRNGINVSRIRKRTPIYVDDHIHIIGVSTMFPFHGFDRLLYGMAEYYEKEHDQKIVFHIVGDGPGPELRKYTDIVDQLSLSEFVRFEGRLTGTKLDELYDKCQLAVCSLAMHRAGIGIASSLKTREYMAKGFPMITGCPIDVFEGINSKYVLEYANDDSPIDVERIVLFANELFKESDQTIIDNIRTLAEEKCDTSVTMKEIFEYLETPGL